MVTPVAPVGLRDREAGTVGFTTSLGFGRKLDRIRENPRVALAYHAREHGFAEAPRFVLVQGTASYDSAPDRAVSRRAVRPASVRFLGPPQQGHLLGPLAERLLRRPGARDGEGRAGRCPGRTGSARASGTLPAALRREPPAADAPPQGQRPARRRRSRGAAPQQAAARPARRHRRRRLPAVVPVRVGAAGADGHRRWMGRCPAAVAAPGCSRTATSRS